MSPASGVFCDFFAIAAALRFFASSRRCSRVSSSCAGLPSSSPDSSSEDSSSSDDSSSTLSGCSCDYLLDSLCDFGKSGTYTPHANDLAICVQRL
jgi:hypothetical protein